MSGEPMSDQSLSERVEADDTGDPATFNREWWDDITRHWNFPMGLFTQYESWQIAADEWSDGVSYEVRESDPSNPDFPWCEATLSGHLDATPTALEVIVRALNGVPVLLAEVDRLTAERVGHTLVPDAILEGLGQHDASGTDHLEEAMEACRERDVAEAEVRRLEAENARLRVISEAAHRLAFAAKQLEGWTDAFDTAAAEVIIATRTAPEQPANEAGEDNEHG